MNEYQQVDREPGRGAGRQREGSPTYRTGDIWQAAYLAVMGVELLWVEATPGTVRRNTWVFSNEGDAAFANGREFRTADFATVPVIPFKNAYCEMARLASAARRERDANENVNH